MWDRIRPWFDNPILIKHVRSRLRRQPALSSLSVVVLLCLCVAYAGYALDIFKTGSAAGMIVAIQFVLLVIMGSGQVGASVSGARTSGILDFHRVSPMSPTELTLGFFFGAPIREYVLFAATLPFTRALHGLRHPQPPRVHPAHAGPAHDQPGCCTGWSSSTALISKGKMPARRHRGVHHLRLSSSAVPWSCGGQVLREHGRERYPVGILRPVAAVGAGPPAVPVHRSCSSSSWPRPARWSRRGSIPSPSRRPSWPC